MNKRNYADVNYALMEGNYHLSASRDDAATPKKIFAYIRAGKLFKLTGAYKRMT